MTTGPVRAQASLSTKVSSLQGPREPLRGFLLCPQKPGHHTCVIHGCHLGRPRGNRAEKAHLEGLVQSESPVLRQGYWRTKLRPEDRPGAGTQQKGLQVGHREGREFLGCCAHLGVEDGWCHHWPRSWPKVLSPGFLVGGAWGEADKVGTVERVGSMKAGTCLVSHMGAEEVCGATGGGAAVVHEAQAWGISSLGPQACPLLWAGEQGHGAPRGERTSGFGEHLGAGASGHREVTVNQ